MKRTVLNRIIPIILTIVCAAAIFMFSRQNGTDSAGLSDSLLHKLIAVYERIFPERGLPSPERLKALGYLLRKAAHLFIYFLLGILSCWSGWALFRRWYSPAALLFCFLYACTDELHQSFSMGRNGVFSDVLLDTAGALFGIIYMTLLIACIRSINRSGD